MAGRFDDKSKPRSAQLTVTERVDETGATVRRAFGALLGAARPCPPKQPEQQVWSDATSQQADQDALQAGQDTPPADEPRP